MSGLPKFYKCGCAIRDEELDSGFLYRVIFRSCKKHRKEMKSCSWETWAKKFAPKQYKQYQKDKGK
jgi:hypothetical protein